MASMKRFAYPILISILALALVPIASVLWFFLVGSRIMSVEGAPNPHCMVGLVTLLWPGILLARVGMGNAWLVGALCLLGLSALLVWVSVRFARRKFGGLVVPGLSLLASVIYCGIGTMAHLTPIPLPVTTRYDSNPSHRSEFERYWKAAYRRGEVGFSHTWCFRPELETRGYESGLMTGLRTWRRLFGMDDSMGLTPLMWAVVDGDEDAVACILTEGADVDARDPHGCTPLMFAINRGPATRSMVDLLLRRGADVNAADNGGWTPLMMAAGACPGGPLELLIQGGANINARTKKGGTALMVTAMNGTSVKADRLLRAGAGVDVENGEGETPLLIAASCANTEVVKVLLDHGANIEHRDQYGYTALAKVVSSGYHAKDETIRVLLDYGASIEVRDNRGRTLPELMHSTVATTVKEILEMQQPQEPSPPKPQSARRALAD